MMTNKILDSFKAICQKQLKENALVKKMVSNFQSLGKLFLFVVVIPTVAAVLYFGLIASDVYVSESKFVIRSPQKNQGAGLGALLNNVGFDQSVNDSYIVSNFMVSMDALKYVDNKIDLAKLFTSRDIDIFHRFASFYWNESYERLLEYFRAHVEVSIDTQSSILTLKTRAYDSESAYKINQLLLISSDRLVNDINDQSRLDLIKFSSFEVEEAKKSLVYADKELVKFRTNKKSEDILDFVPKFQTLTLEREMAEKQLSTALSALEQARIDAQRKRLYLERIVEPSVPDFALEPQRIRGMIAVLFFSLIVWGVIKMLVAGVREHMD